MRNACRKDESRGGIRQCANMLCDKWRARRASLPNAGGAGRPSIVARSARVGRGQNDISVGVVQGRRRVRGEAAAGGQEGARDSGDGPREEGTANARSGRARASVSHSRVPPHA
jgi:hypothetical protein